MLSEDTIDFNLPDTLDLGFIQDAELLRAQEQAMASNSITPLLKQELRLKIQTRRLTEGKDELQLPESNDGSISYELTPAEVEKRIKRRDQNRRAAKKFRQKKRNETDTFKQEIEILQAKNSALREKVTYLVKERTRLLRLHAEHLLNCKRPPPTSVDQ